MGELKLNLPEKQFLYIVPSSFLSPLTFIFTFGVSMLSSFEKEGINDVEKDGHLYI